MTQADTTVLETSGVTVRAGCRTLVETIDFALRPGRVQILAGPNGAGKSTLLRVLTGETTPDEGTVHLHGNPLHNYENGELARRRACLPQSSTLSFPFTIREVAAIGRLPYREHRRKRERIIDRALDRVGLLDRDAESYLHLSGGEKQRVHLARVLAQLGDPGGGILLLDEPTSSLDLTFQQLVFAIAAEWAERGAAVLIVLHDLNQAMRFGSWVTVLDHGRVAGQGPPRDVLTPGLLEQVYRVRARWVESGAHRLLAVEGSATNENL